METSHFHTAAVNSSLYSHLRYENGDGSWWPVPIRIHAGSGKIRGCCLLSAGNGSVQDGLLEAPEGVLLVTLNPAGNCGHIDVAVQRNLRQLLVPANDVLLPQIQVSVVIASLDVVDHAHGQIVQAALAQVVQVRTVVAQSNSKKAGGNIRQYRKEDIENVRLVYHLVKEKGLTLAGAKQRLKMNKETVVQTSEIVERLQKVREKLVQLRAELDYIN